MFRLLLMRVAGAAATAGECVEDAVALQVSVPNFHAALATAAKMPQVSLEAPQPSPPGRRSRIAVAVGVGPTYEHQLEFMTLMHQSWLFVTSQDDGQHDYADLDLVVSCERCDHLPIECLPLPAKPERGHHCFFAQNNDPDLTYFKKMQHPAMLSVSFLAVEPLRSFLLDYDYVLRSDQDALITPRLLSWRPPRGAVFGNAGVEIDWTKKRLEAIAKELGWRHQGVHNICSGWFVPSKLAITLADLTTIASKHLLENEYGWRADKGYMAKTVKLGDMAWWTEKNEGGEWPKWWRGVTSLYASNLAINHLVKNFSRDMVTKDVDKATLESGNVMNHVHLHCIEGEGGFNKYLFVDEVQAGRVQGLSKTVKRLIQMGDELRHDWEKDNGRNLSIILSDVSKYSTWIAARGVQAATDIFDYDRMPRGVKKSEVPKWYSDVSRRSQ